MRKFVWILSFLFAALLIPTVVKADGIQYTVNQTEGAFTVTGTITTDGAIGTLTSADIVAWNLTLDSISLNTGNSTMLLVGDALTASASQLTFDFTAGGSSNSYLNFHDPSYVSWWDTVSQPPYLGYQGIAELTGLGGENYSYISGSQVIADSGTPVNTPEPGTSSLILVGAGLLGLMVMRKGFSVRPQQAA
jgi:hypothetical protein